MCIDRTVTSAAHVRIKGIPVDGTAAPLPWSIALRSHRQLSLAEASGCVHEGDAANLAAPAFDKGSGQRIRRKQTGFFSGATST